MAVRGLGDAGRGDLRWVLASGNPGKAREFEALLRPLGVRIALQADFGIAEADEPFATFVENALAKARHASRGSGLAAIADDSGICVPALGGAPGVRSARYAEPPAQVAGADGADGADGAGEAARAGGPLPRDRQDVANNCKLIEATAVLPQPVACFYCCVVVLVRHPDDPRPVIAEGTWPGTLVARPRGTNGFGYDPHFLPDGQTLTAAEMDPDAKNRVSHRGRALAALLAQLAG